MAQRQISPARRGLYYLGMAVLAFGAALFVSVLVTGILHFGDFTNFESRTRNEGLRAISGMVLIVVGAALMGVGRAGLAGSGVVLDPERARRDVEPWARMTGGIVRDAIDEAGIDISRDAQQVDLPFDEKLRRLHQLYEDGILDEAEYQREKADILAKN